MQRSPRKESLKRASRPANIPLIIPPRSEMDDRSQRTPKSASSAYEDSPGSTANTSFESDILISGDAHRTPQMRTSRSTSRRVPLKSSNDSPPPNKNISPSHLLPNRTSPSRATMSNKSATLSPKQSADIFPIRDTRKRSISCDRMRVSFNRDNTLPNRPQNLFPASHVENYNPKIRHGSGSQLNEINTSNSDQHLQMFKQKTEALFRSASRATSNMSTPQISRAWTQRQMSGETSFKSQPLVSPSTTNATKPSFILRQTHESGPDKILADLCNVPYLVRLSELWEKEGGTGSGTNTPRGGNSTGTHNTTLFGSASSGLDSSWGNNSLSSLSGLPRSLKSRQKMIRKSLQLDSNFFQNQGSQGAVDNCSPVASAGDGTVSETLTQMEREDIQETLDDGSSTEKGSTTDSGLDGMGRVIFFISGNDEFTPRTIYEIHHIQEYDRHLDEAIHWTEENSPGTSDAHLELQRGLEAVNLFTAVGSSPGVKLRHPNVHSEDFPEDSVTLERRRKFQKKTSPEKDDSSTGVTAKWQSEKHRRSSAPSAIMLKNRSRSLSLHSLIPDCTITVNRNERKEQTVKGPGSETRRLLYEGAVKLSKNRAQSRYRYIFICSDVVLFGKSKNDSTTSTFALKLKLDMAQIWLDHSPIHSESCPDSMSLSQTQLNLSGDALSQSHGSGGLNNNGHHHQNTSFVMGWPPSEYNTLTFSHAEDAILAWRILETAICNQRSRLNSCQLTAKVVNQAYKEKAQSKCVTLNPEWDVNTLKQTVLQSLDNENKVNDVEIYLCVDESDSSKLVKLKGCENPFAIVLYLSRDRTSGSTSSSSPRTPNKICGIDVPDMENQLRTNFVLIPRKMSSEDDVNSPSRSSSSVGGSGSMLKSWHKGSRKLTNIFSRPSGSTKDNGLTSSTSTLSTSSYAQRQQLEAQAAGQRRIFGHRLMEIWPDGRLPESIMSLFALTFKYRQVNEGLFRTCASNVNLTKMIDLIDQSDEAIEDKPCDVKTAAATIKRLLRDIPDGLLDSSKSKSWQEALDSTDEQIRYERVVNIIQSLPIANQRLFSVLIVLLGMVAKDETFNKMSASNLAIILAPNLGFTQSLGGSLEADLTALAAKSSQSSQSPTNSSTSSMVDLCTWMIERYSYLVDYETQESIISNWEGLMPPEGRTDMTCSVMMSPGGSGKMMSVNGTLPPRVLGEEVDKMFHSADDLSPTKNMHEAQWSSGISRDSGLNLSDQLSRDCSMDDECHTNASPNSLVPPVIQAHCQLARESSLTPVTPPRTKRKSSVGTNGNIPYHHKDYNKSPMNYKNTSNDSGMPVTPSPPLNKPSSYPMKAYMDTDTTEVPNDPTLRRGQSSAISSNVYASHLRDSTDSDFSIGPDSLLTTSSTSTASSISRNHHASPSIHIQQSSNSPSLSNQVGQIQLECSPSCKSRFLRRQHRIITEPDGIVSLSNHSLEACHTSTPISGVVRSASKASDLTTRASDSSSTTMMVSRNSSFASTANSVNPGGAVTRSDTRSPTHNLNNASSTSKSSISQAGSVTVRRRKSNCEDRCNTFYKRQAPLAPTDLITDRQQDNGDDSDVDSKTTSNHRDSDQVSAVVQNSETPKSEVSALRRTKPVSRNSGRPLSSCQNNMRGSTPQLYTENPSPSISTEKEFVNSPINKYKSEHVINIPTNSKDGLVFAVACSSTPTGNVKRTSSDSSGSSDITSEMELNKMYRVLQPINDPYRASSSLARLYNNPSPINRADTVQSTPYQGITTKFSHTSHKPISTSEDHPAANDKFNVLKGKPTLYKHTIDDQLKLRSNESNSSNINNPIRRNSEKAKVQTYTPTASKSKEFSTTHEVSTERNSRQMERRSRQTSSSSRSQSIDSIQREPSSNGSRDTTTVSRNHSRHSGVPFNDFMGKSQGPAPSVSRLKQNFEVGREPSAAVLRVNANRGKTSQIRARGEPVRSEFNAQEQGFSSKSHLRRKQQFDNTDRSPVIFGTEDRKMDQEAMAKRRLPQNLKKKLEHEEESFV